MTILESPRHLDVRPVDPIRAEFDPVIRKTRELPVLVHAPPSALQDPGGGEVQLYRTTETLRRMGVPLAYFDPWRDRIADARALHLYGMSREGLTLARLAKRVGTPVVLSPICWIDPGAMRASAPNRLKGWRDQILWTAQGVIPALPTWRRELLRLADLVLPNSNAEADQLRNRFGVDRSRIWVVPNGIDPDHFEVGPDRFRLEVTDEPFVLFVGRIEPRKNVLRLITACHSEGLPLIIIGTSRASDRGYEADCRRLSERSTASVHWLGALPHSDPLLASAYSACRVLALPSWFETPGLVALEAGAAGAAVVVTERGGTRDYFGDRAHYIRPGSVRSIARALRMAWRSGPHPDLRRHIHMHYTWTQVADRTEEAYQRVAG